MGIIAIPTGQVEENRGPKENRTSSGRMLQARSIPLPEGCVSRCNNVWSGALREVPSLALPKENHSRHRDDFCRLTACTVPLAEFTKVTWTDLVVPFFPFFSSDRGQDGTMGW